MKLVDQRTCSYCLIICKNKFERKKHEATVHENKGKYNCDICGKTYSNKNALGYHLTNKHGDGKMKSQQIEIAHRDSD